MPEPNVAKQTNEDFLDGILDRFMRAPMKRNGRGELTAEMDATISPEETYRLCQIAVDSFKQQQCLVRINNTDFPLTICGDIHGQFRDIRIIMERCGWLDKHAYLFMGDYGDRGVQGVETICFLLAAKARFPDRCFMLRGNHEDYNTSMVYGLLDECLGKYGNFFGQRVWLMLINVFNHMPFSALIQDKIIAMHGGLSPDLKSLDDINKISRPCIVPLYGLACDLVWADPSNAHEGWALSPRGISFTFDDKVAEQFCQKHGIELIVRGHQITNDMHRTGYRFSANNRVLTLFTASDYLRSQNTGATMTVTPNLSISFTLFRPQDKKKFSRKARAQRKMDEKQAAGKVSGD